MKAAASLEATNPRQLAENEPPLSARRCSLSEFGFWYFQTYVRNLSSKNLFATISDARPIGLKAPNLPLSPVRWGNVSDSPCCQA